MRGFITIGSVKSGEHTYVGVPYHLQRYRNRFHKYTGWRSKKRPRMKLKRHTFNF